jgi:hypothetical protein
VFQKILLKVRIVKYSFMEGQQRVSSLSKKEKKQVEALILEECNNNYYNTSGQKTTFHRRDGKWSAEQVYEAFKADPLWHVKLREGGSVSFRERKEKETSKKNWQSTMMLFVHHLTKHKWKLSMNAAQVVIYGGFARSAMIAWLSCRSAMYEAILCFRRWKLPKDVLKLILCPILRTWCNDFTWFRDKVRDIDVLVSYRYGYKPGESTFKNDVDIIRDNLDELCLETLGCRYSYEEDIHDCYSGKVWDGNSHRRGITSYREGDFYNYLVTFCAPPYKGKKVTRCTPSIHLDITTMVGYDRSDVDVNNLVLYFDTRLKRFKFGQRKTIVFPEGELRMKNIAQHIQRRQFRHVPLDYKKFDSFKAFMTLFRQLDRRISDLEYRGWRQDSKYPKFDTKSREPEILKKAERYFDSFKEKGVRETNKRK